MTLDPATARRAARWFTPADCRLEDFREDVEVVTDPAAPYFGAVIDDRSIVPTGPVTIFETTFADWLSARQCA